jgi:hypothetical protein
MASKLVTERGFPQRAVLVFGDHPHHHVREGPLGFDWFRPHLVDVRGIVDRPPPKRSAGALRGDPKSPGNKTSVISGREAPRPRNTTPSPYPALCRAGSRDGQFGGNALGHACSLTFATADITTQQAHPKRRPRVSKRHAFPTHLGCGTDVRSSDVHVGTRLGAKLPGPQPPQEYVDDLRGSFSPFRESGSGASSCPMIVA